MPPRPPPDTVAVRFVDFAIRAWRTDPQHVEVIAHSTPVGGMRHPVSLRQPRIRPPTWKSASATASTAPPK